MNVKQLFAASLTLLSVSATAQNKVKFVEYDLKNGLHVILHEDHSTPLVAVTAMYHVGSKTKIRNVLVLRIFSNTYSSKVRKTLVATNSISTLRMRVEL